MSEDDASNSGFVMQKVDRIIKRIPVLNMNSDPILNRSEFINARASTAEPKNCKKLQLTLGLAHHSFEHPIQGLSDLVFVGTGHGAMGASLRAFLWPHWFIESRFISGFSSGF